MLLIPVEVQGRDACEGDGFDGGGVARCAALEDEQLTAAAQALRYVDAVIVGVVVYVHGVTESGVGTADADVIGCGEDIIRAGAEIRDDENRSVAVAVRSANVGQDHQVILFVVGNTVGTHQAVYADVAIGRGRLPVWRIEKIVEDGDGIGVVNNGVNRTVYELKAPQVKVRWDGFCQRKSAVFGEAVDHNGIGVVVFRAGILGHYELTVSDGYEPAAVGEIGGGGVDYVYAIGVVEVIEHVLIVHQGAVGADDLKDHFIAVIVVNAVGVHPGGGESFHFQRVVVYVQYTHQTGGVGGHKERAVVRQVNAEHIIVVVAGSKGEGSKGQ